MNKKISIALTVGGLLFLGCAEKNITKDSTLKEASSNNDVYSVVVAKSIRECQEHGITLDEDRTNAFMRRSPKATIEKAAVQEAKTPKKLCQFFSEETSLEKVKQVAMFTSKIITGCKQHGVELAKETIYSKVQKLPFFVIKKGLAMQGQSSLEECQLMGKKSIK